MESKLTEQEKKNITKSVLEDVLAALDLSRIEVTDVDGYFEEYKLDYSAFAFRLEQKIKSLTPPENT